MGLEQDQYKSSSKQGSPRNKAQSSNSFKSTGPEPPRLPPDHVTKSSSSAQFKIQNKRPLTSQVGERDRQSQQQAAIRVEDNRGAAQTAGSAAEVLHKGRLTRYGCQFKVVVARSPSKQHVEYFVYNKKQQFAQKILVGVDKFKSWAMKDGGIEKAIIKGINSIDGSLDNGFTIKA